MTQAKLENPPSSDQRIIHSGLNWEQFKLIQAGFAESRRVRLFYSDNTIEIIMPGREHEFFKTIIGMLIELFCLETETEFYPLGSTTQEREGEVAVEPDESYCFGELKNRPDWAIEVVFTSGGPDKLHRYRSLEIPEVWFWREGTFHLYHLRGSDYEDIVRSEIPELIKLDLELFGRCVLMAQTSRLEAAKTLRNGLK